MSQSPAHPDRSFPRLHPRPAKGWLNDPNGIHYADGRWQVFFQYNPASARHEWVHWGHVSSPDLLRWEQHPIALAPQTDSPDEYGCWTGVAVDDDGVVTLVYSGVRDGWGHSQVLLAPRGADGGWRQEGHVAAPMPPGESFPVVRDPYVFELGGRRWGIQAASTETGEPAVLLYDASDLAAWEYRGTLLTADDPVAAAMPPVNAWECPQLVRLGEDWVLIGSAWRLGDPQDVVYLIGSLELDGATGLPRFTPRASGVLDDGPSLYAPQAVPAGGADGGPERVLVWGWARELVGDEVRARTEAERDAAGWSGTLTHPLELIADGDRVFTVPARELIALRGEAADPAELPDQAELILSGVGAAELRLAAPGEVGQLVWRRRLSGEQVRVLIDASLVEVFPEGRTAGTHRAYPTGEQSYRLVTEPGVHAQAWTLRLP